MRVVIVERPFAVSVSDTKIEVPIGTASFYVCWHGDAHARDETLTEVERGMVIVYVPVWRVLFGLLVPSDRNLSAIRSLSQRVERKQQPEREAKHKSAKPGRRTLRHVLYSLDSIMHNAC